MELHALLYFKKVAELQHITKAAEELHVAQPALSRTISNLEKELDIQLFNRIGKNIVLNSYGEIVLKHTNRIVQELLDIKKELLDECNDQNHMVTLSIYAASKLIPQLIRAFKQEYPHIRLKLVQYDLQKDFDSPCDLTLNATMQPISAPGSVTLIEEDILLALPETSPLSHHQSINLIDVAEEEFICLRQGKNLRTLTDMYCKMAGFEPKVIMESDSPEIVRELIGAGIGISFIPSITWSGMDTANIALLPVTAPECKRYINLSWNTDGYLSKSAVCFRDFVKDYFRQQKSL